VSAVESGPLAFSAVDGSCLLQFSDAFDVQPPKLPTVAVYSPKKKRRVLKGKGGLLRRH
jgi:hypothetical protein